MALLSVGFPLMMEAGFGEEVEEPPFVAGKGIFPRAILSAFTGAFISDGFQE